MPIDNKLTRRTFAGLSLGALLGAAEKKPNILWITCEDIGQQLGCYGDKYSQTPVLDGLASLGVRYNNAWSNAPVCAPARTTIISGIYPPSAGAEHMRSLTSLPPSIRMFPCYLRDAGYYATNNSKEDYNLEHTGKVWDDSSEKAHWRNRKAGQPFFAVFNIMTTHESRIIKRPHKLVHDPAAVRVPAYHPDTPEVRHDWAQYYDNITTMDGEAGEILKQLADDGLENDTIVFFYGDHGAGMPRSKRFPYDSGLRVPLLLKVPEPFKSLAPKGYAASAALDRMVAFVDLAPTVLSIAGIRAPAHMQGSAFMGSYPGAARRYNFGFRGRMDERYDLMRSVTDGRYVYIRNYMPHIVYGQYVGTMFQTPTTQVWKKLYDAGKLNAAQRTFWEKKRPEELYDLRDDPDEVNNLAGSRAHGKVLAELRQVNREHLIQTRDMGFLPEGEIHTISRGSTPYQVAHDEHLYPFTRVLQTAERASSIREEELPGLIAALKDPFDGVRYWAATGILIRGEKGVRIANGALRNCLQDTNPYVRAVAADSLVRFGKAEDAQPALDTLLALVPVNPNGTYVSLWALITIDELGAAANPILEKVKECKVEDPLAPDRVRGYPNRLMRKIKGLPRSPGTAQ